MTAPLSDRERLAREFWKWNGYTKRDWEMPYFSHDVSVCLKRADRILSMLGKGKKEDSHDK